MGSREPERGRRDFGIGTISTVKLPSVVIVLILAVAILLTACSQGSEVPKDQGAAGLGPGCQATGPNIFVDRINCAMQQAVEEDFDSPMPDLAEMEDAMKDWFEIDVRPSLIEARECWLTEGCGKELILESAVQIFAEWRVYLMNLESFGVRQVLKDLDQTGKVQALAMFDAAFTKTCRETAAQTTFTFDSTNDLVTITETGLVTALKGPLGQVNVTADEERVKRIELVQRLTKLMPGFVTERIPSKERGPDGLWDAIYICGAVLVEPTKGELQVGESVQLTASIADPYTAEFAYGAVYGQANFIIFEPDKTPPDLGFAAQFVDICYGAPIQGSYFALYGVVKVEMLVPRLGIVLELFSSETPQYSVTGVWSFQIPPGLQPTTPYGSINIDLVATDAAGNVGRMAGGTTYGNSCDD